MWDAKSGELRHTLEGHTEEVNAVALSQDGDTIVSGSNDGTVKVFSKSDWSLKTSIDPGVGRVQDLDQDDRHIYFGCADGNIRFIAKGLLDS